MMNRIYDYLNELTSNKMFSGNVLIAHNDDILFEKSYGYASYQLNVKNHVNTKFLIASITKSITALAILILASEKKLNINDSLSQYIPDYPNGNKITLYHLLTHTAGIPEIVKHNDIDSFRNENHTIEELISRFKNQILDFEPGFKFNYSNSGYTLLAYIIEKVATKSYEEYVEEKIFKPLNMSKTGCYSYEKIIKDLANGYNKENEHLINSSVNYHSSIFYGAGNLYSTIHDIYQLAKGLKEGKLLNSDFYQKWLTLHSVIEDDYYSGFGCIIHKPKDIELIYQDGGLANAKSIYMIYPKTGLIIVILSNFGFIKVAEIANEIEKRMERN